ncbi:MAG TPA: AAA family ATPase, partial [Candidatus Dormibacteraeota bacterium]|nr:AAA family ATPase [Candidatus Dormibacteraeota bacterium]
EDVVLSAAGGDGAAAVLVGDAGLGKTRLCTELRARAARLGCEVLWGSCSEDELSLSYLPIVEALGNRLGASDRAAIREQLGGSVVSDLSQILPQLAPDGPRIEGADGGHSRIRLFEAVLTLLRVLGGGRPVLLVVDDLHWADTATCELVDYLMRRVRTAPIALVVTSRKDELGRDHPVLARMRGWQRARLAEWVELRPLGRESVGGMVSAIFDERDVTEEFQRLLHDRSEGNPFVLEEMLKEAIDRGDIHRDGAGGWTRREIGEISLPRTVADTILMRVERLGADEVAVLEAASAIGGAFSTELMAAVSDLPAADVQAATAACIREQLLEREPAGAHVRFRHALTRRALYESLLPARCRALHGRVATALGAQPGTPPVEVAHHLLAAERRDEAVPFCIAAAEEATLRYAVAEAADLYSRCLPHVDDPELRGSLLSRLGEALQLASEPERGLGYLREGIELLEKAGASLEAARHRLALGRCLWEREQPELAAAEFERARETLEPAGPSAELARAYIRLAGVRVFAYEAVEAQALSRRALEIAEAAGATSERIWALTYLGLAHLHRGQVAEGISLVDRCHEEAMSAGLRWIADTSLINSLAARMLAWRFGEMTERLERLRALPEGPLRDLMVPTFETHAHYAVADLDGAERSAAEYLAHARDMGHVGYEVAASNRLAEILTEMGRLEEARDVLPVHVVEREDLAVQWVNLMRLEAAEGDVAAAADVAARVRDAQGWSVPPWLSDAAVETFVAAGRVDDAEAVISRPELPLHAPASRALLDRAEGRIALADGDHSRAIELLSASARALAADG